MANVRRSRQRKRNRRGRMIVSIMAVILVAIFMVQSMQLEAKNLAYEKQLAQLQKDYDEELDRQSSLQNREKYTQTKKFVEEYAKEKLGLIYPNEVVFKAE